MPADYVTNPAPGWPRLGHRVRVETPVMGRDLIACDDPLAASICEWMEDPRNDTDGLWGLVDVEPIRGDALANGVRYWFGFTHTEAAMRFRDQFAAPVRDA